MKKLFIGGLTGSGKGLLKTLLDGHPQVFNLYFQSLGVPVLSREFQKKMTTESLVIDRIRLGAGEGDLDRLAISFNDAKLVVSAGKVCHYMMANDPAVLGLMVGAYKRKIKDSHETPDGFVPFDFDYPEFLNGFARLIAQGGRDHEYTPEALLDAYYSCFLDAWKNRASFELKEGFVANSIKSNAQAMEEVLQTTSNSKVIFLRRDPIGLVFTNAKKQFEIKNPGEDWRGSSKFDKILLTENFISRVKEDTEAFEALVAAYPTRIYTVGFEELVQNTETTMSGIAEFLGISDSQNLYRPSLSGRLLPSNRVGKIVDDPSALPKRQIQLLQSIFEKSDFKGIISQPVTYLQKTAWENKNRLRAVRNRLIGH